MARKFPQPAGRLRGRYGVMIESAEEIALWEAAPDLLEACEAALEGLEETIHMPRQKAMLRAAIAKAKGER